jgi:hypothetical protein
LTVNVAVQVLDEESAATAVPTYVVVAVGATVVEPLAWVIGPSGLIDPETAFCDVHESVAELPRTIDAGLNDNVHVAADGVTVMDREQVLVPPAPVTVAVYVVVTAGVTEREPLATGVTLPIP